jgi:RimJ/RimL family protein N-acetyltransferase
MADLQLVEVRAFGYEHILWALLKERDIETTSISHRAMPSWEEHVSHVKFHDYKDWCLICLDDGTVLGVVYLSPRDEIGIQIFRAHQGNAYGEWAVRAMMARHPEVKRFLANINPRNSASIALFRKLGFTDLQITLELRNDRPDDPDRHHEAAADTGE